MDEPYRLFNYWNRISSTRQLSSPINFFKRDNNSASMRVVSLGKSIKCPLPPSNTWNEKRSRPWNEINVPYSVLIRRLSRSLSPVERRITVICLGGCVESSSCASGTYNDGGSFGSTFIGTTGRIATASCGTSTGFCSSTSARL